MARRRKTVLEEIEKLKENEVIESTSEEDEDENISEEDENKNLLTDEELKELEEKANALEDEDENLDSEEIADEKVDAEEGLEDAAEELEDIEENDSDLDGLNSKLDEIIASINSLKDALENDDMEEVETDSTDESDENTVETSEGEEDMYKKEDFSPIFNDENVTLTEDFKKKANIVFNAVLAEKVNTIAKKLAEKSKCEVNKKTKKIMETFINDVNDYFEYLTEQWMEENKLAVELGIRNNLVENVLFKFKKALAESYIDLPDQDLTLIEELNNKSKLLKKQMDHVLSENIKLKKMIVESNKTNIQHTIAEGLNSLEADKFKKLSRAIDFESPEQYKKDLITLKETVCKRLSTSQGSQNDVKNIIKETSQSISRPPIVENNHDYMDIQHINPTMRFGDNKKPDEEMTAIDKYVSNLSQSLRV